MIQAVPPPGTPPGRRSPMSTDRQRDGPFGAEAPERPALPPVDAHSPLAARGGSDDVEALGVLDGLDELLLRVLEALVLGEQQVVEARVRGGEPVLVRAVLGDDEGEVAQPLDGHAVGARAEEEEALLHLDRQAVHRLPQVGDGRVVAREAVVVLRDALEGGEVEHGRPADEQLELLPAEELQAVAAAHRVEAALEGVELPLDGEGHRVVRVQAHVLLAVGLGDGDLAAARYEVVRELLAIPLVAHLHAQAEALDVGLGEVEERLQAAPHLGECGLEVLEPDRLVHELLVHDVWEAHVQDDAVVDGDAEEDADQLELAVALEGVLVEPEGAERLVVGEHSVAHVEDLRDDELEELLLHAALVDALLAHELHLERLLEVLLAQGHLQQRVRDEMGPPHAHDEVGRGRADKERAQDGALELLRHLRGRVVHENPTLGGRLEHIRMLAEGELIGAARLPTTVVLLEVDLLVDSVVVEEMERQPRPAAC
mmetsp:Transcript_11500/g.28707  ORF Transcript_11500/g.28707 Transcript_11500/m.28707 type:complete len:485 (-) Transcript_11500:933-2387(-)